MCERVVLKRSWSLEFVLDQHKMQECAKRLQTKIHCVKSVQIRRFFCYVFFCIRTEYRDLRSESLHPVRVQENMDQKNLRIWTLFMQWSLWLGRFWWLESILILLNLTKKYLLDQSYHLVSKRHNNLRTKTSFFISSEGEIETVKEFKVKFFRYIAVSLRMTIVQIVCLYILFYILEIQEKIIR